MEQLIYPLEAPEAGDPTRFGPKASNLAALSHGGLPTPGGYCLDAAAYRLQIKALGLEASARGAFSSDVGPQARVFALQM
jgi:phosphoenolpyruvate synthase/pyruvate phosphate dikinase